MLIRKRLIGGHKNCGDLGPGLKSPFLYKNRDLRPGQKKIIGVRCGSFGTSFFWRFVVELVACRKM